MVIVWIAYLVAWVFAARWVLRSDKQRRRERFERTNEAGVLEFSSFEESERFNRRQSWGFFAGLAILMPGGVIALICVIGLVATFG